MDTTLVNRNMSSFENYWLENYENSTNDTFKNSISQLTNKARRFRRQDDEDYEIVCKHSNTGMAFNIFGPVLMHLSYKILQNMVIKQL